MAQFSLISNSNRPTMGKPNTKSNISESTCFKTTMGSSWSDSKDDPVSDQHAPEKRVSIEQTTKLHISCDNQSFDNQSINNESYEGHLSEDEFSEDHTEKFPIPVVIADYNQIRLDDLRVDALSPMSGFVSTPFANPNFIGNSTQHSMDSSFVYVKPDFNCKLIRDLTRSTILNAIMSGNGRIAEELVILAEDIENGNLIDAHYQATAQNAMLTSVKKMNISTSDFRSAFEEDIDAVIKESRIFNAAEALTECNCTPEQLDEAWREAENFIPSTKKVIKFRKGLYCANIQINQKYVYVINGFYMALRKKYTLQNQSMYAFVIHWDSSLLPWNEFQTKVIGAKNPADAQCGSIRKIVHDKYEEFGLASKPDRNNNAVHASASPLQGLIERCNWLPREVRDDEYGQILLRKGIPEPIILSWFKNSRVNHPSSQPGEAMQSREIFDIVKGMNTGECTKSLLRIYDNELFGCPDKNVCPKSWCCMS